jgi:hypothetical protein
MATITNPSSRQNVIDRFADYVVATANAGIVFGLDAKPFGTNSSYFPDAELGGTTSGKVIGIAGSNLGNLGSTMTAATVYSVLVAETNAYTRIRNLRAILFITGTGFITPRPNGQASFPTDLRTDIGPIFGAGPGVIYDQTQVANLNTTRIQDVGTITATGIATSQTISASNMEAFFTNLQTAYNTARANTVTSQQDVCHASCHSNCHSSRGRR